MKRYAIVAAVALLGSAAGPALAQSSPGGASASREDGAVDTKTYVAKAAATDQFEIQSSRVVLEKSKDADVRAFAQMMVDHHTQTSKELMAAVQQSRLSAPPTALPPEKASKVEALRGVSGDALDTQYLKEQVKGHEAALALHSGYARNGENPTLRAVAAKTAPIVEQHLAKARSLAAK